MKNNFTPLVDEHLASIQGMQEAATDEFFYTRLKAKMARGTGRLMLKPVWVIGVLVVLLGVNGYMLSEQSKKDAGVQRNSSSVQGFAQSYDQTISSY